jgi:hypothetical protein
MYATIGFQQVLLTHLVVLDVVAVIMERLRLSPLLAVMIAVIHYNNLVQEYQVLIQVKQKDQ